MHTDPELLGLLALGEQVGTQDDHDHARTCTACAGELSELRRVVSLGRGAEITLLSPSPAVWARIQVELALGSAPDQSSVDSPVDAAPAAESDELTGHARLQPVDSLWSHASGTAQLGTDERGRRLVQVALHVDLPTSGVRQAWLVHRDDPNQRQTLGILDGRNGLWTVEHSIDLEKYSILDISQQGIGETQHSGRTIVRGEFTLVS